MRMTGGSRWAPVARTLGVLSLVPWIAVSALVATSGPSWSALAEYVGLDAGHFAMLIRGDAFDRSVRRFVAARLGPPASAAR
jgi:hypothetical protein